MGQDTKFTPGPWVAQIGHSDWGMPCSHVILRDGDLGNNFDEWIAEIHSETPYVAGSTRKERVRSGRQFANAHLISAAPDMYEALPDLSHVIAWLENGCDPKKAAQELRIYANGIDAAKAKARGEQ